MGKHNDLYEKEGWGRSRDFASFSSSHGSSGENTSEDPPQFLTYHKEHQKFSSDLYLDVVSPPFLSCNEEVMKIVSVSSENSLLDEPKKEKLLASLEILKKYGSGFKRMKGETIEVPRYGITGIKPESKVVDRKLSMEDVLRLAGEKFIQTSSQKVDDFSSLSHPFGTLLLGLSNDEIKEVELVQNLLASAEKVGQQRYDCAGKLLTPCEDLSSETGNHVERIVYYYAKALREKIDQETERIIPKGIVKKQLVDIDETMMRPNSAILAFHQEVPLSQISIFAGTQAIVERVTGAKRIHLIDLEIRIGLHCAVLMQALAGRSDFPIELLKITAVTTKSISIVEETGERLMAFAQSINLSFSFSVVVVSDILDLSEDLFDLDDEEIVAVNASYSLRAMLPSPDGLESLMRVIRNLKPCVMVVTEVEGKHNSPVFVKRFIESLFFYGAFFDCIEDCMDRSDPNRKIIESMYLSHGIRNMVATEGEERKIRHVNIGVWRAFFTRFGMIEEEVSTSSWYQARLVAKTFTCGSCCTFHVDGKSLIVGWKGTPLQSISAWTFIESDCVEEVVG